MQKKGKKKRVLSMPRSQPRPLTVRVCVLWVCLTSSCEQKDTLVSDVPEEVDSGNSWEDFEANESVLAYFQGAWWPAVITKRWRLNKSFTLKWTGNRDWGSTQGYQASYIKKLKQSSDVEDD